MSTSLLMQCCVENKDLWNDVGEGWSKSEQLAGQSKAADQSDVDATGVEQELVDVWPLSCDCSQP